MPVPARLLPALGLCLSLAAAGCGDSGTGVPTDGPAGRDGRAGDAPPDARPGMDAGGADTADVPTEDSAIADGSSDQNGDDTAVDGNPDGSTDESSPDTTPDAPQESEADANLDGVPDAPPDAVVGPPASLEFAVQPSNTVAGVAIAPAVSVVIKDAMGAVVTGATGMVAIALGANPGATTLQGTTSVAPASGVASFGDLRIDRARAGYTLVASYAGVANVTSVAFDISPAAATTLSFARQPVSGTDLNAVITPSVQVQILDSLGNRVTSSTAPVSIALAANPTAATLGGTLTQNAAAGVASFEDLTVNKIGMGYTLAGSSAGLTGATSNAFSISSGPPASIVFLVQPSTQDWGAFIEPEVAIEIRDQYGNPVTEAWQVTMTLAANPTGATLSGGDTRVTGGNGRLSYSTLMVSRLGSGYTLRAATTGAEVVSDPFAVVCMAHTAPPLGGPGSTCRGTFPPAAGVPCAVPATTTSRYVNGGTGNDANDGQTPGTAWQSLCRAMDAAPDGSTILVAGGVYTNGRMTVARPLTVKGGYNATFSTWNPDANPTVFSGWVTLDHDQAVVGGFRLITRANSVTNRFRGHLVRAGTLLRNYVEMVGSFTTNPVGVTGIQAGAAANRVTALLCNDVYMRTEGGSAHNSTLLSLGSHSGGAFIDSNRLCTDATPATWANNTIAGHGPCLSTGQSARVIITNNIIETALSPIMSSVPSQPMEFYGCGLGTLEVIVTNNTVLARAGYGIHGYGNGAALVDWKLTNNIIAAESPRAALDLGTNGVQISTAEGNLIFGWGNNGFSPAPTSSSGNDVTGASTFSSVFAAPSSGDFRLLGTGAGVGTGLNVHGSGAYGGVTLDLVQQARPTTGNWDRGAYRY